jgi:hypothetical protein
MRKNDRPEFASGNANTLADGNVRQGLGQNTRLTGTLEFIR